MRVISLSLYEPVLGVPRVDQLPAIEVLRFTTPPVALLPLMVQDSVTVSVVREADKAVGASGAISVLSMMIKLTMPFACTGPATISNLLGLNLRIL